MAAPDRSKSCHCEQCARLCRGRPGWFAPGQATKAAEELGLTLPAFFEKYLTIDYWCTSNGDIELLSPAWKVDGVFNVGRRAKWGDAMCSGDCALLTPTGCKLSFETRPAECAAAYGCDKRGCDRFKVAKVDKWKKGSKELDTIRKELDL